MEIQKIFSDYYDEERYYSVLMDEEELALFSSAKEIANEILEKAKDGKTQATKAIRAGRIKLLRDPRVAKAAKFLKTKKGMATVGGALLATGALGTAAAYGRDMD